jgi:hypothetical protein
MAIDDVETTLATDFRFAVALHATRRPERPFTMNTSERNEPAVFQRERPSDGLILAQPVREIGFAVHVRTRKQSRES